MEPLAVSPREAARLLAISKRTVSRLTRSRKLVARKVGGRTLVDVESLKAFYATLPQITEPRPLFGERAHVRPKSRPRSHPRTLIDAASVERHFASLPEIDGPSPLFDCAGVPGDGT